MQSLQAQAAVRLANKLWKSVYGACAPGGKERSANAVQAQVFAEYINTEQSGSQFSGIGA